MVVNQIVEFVEDVSHHDLSHLVAGALLRRPVVGPLLPTGIPVVGVTPAHLHLDELSIVVVAQIHDHLLHLSVV